MPKIARKAAEAKFIKNNKVDLEIDEEGHIKTVENADEWRQRNHLGLIGQEGDFRFDMGEGLPYIDHPRLPVGRRSFMGKHNFPKELISIFIRQQLNRDSRTEKIGPIHVGWIDKPERHLGATTIIKGVQDLGEEEVNL